MSNAKKTFTATYAGVTAEISTARKIAWASFFLLEDGSARLGSFYAGQRATAEKDARATFGINARRNGLVNYRIVPATHQEA
jgi:hypothetical protein